MSELVTAFAGTIQIGLSRAIDGYLLPDGQFRYGLPYVSELLGYGSGYLSHAIRKGSKKLEVLRSKGFSSDLIRVIAPRSTTGASRPYTISFDDFCIFVEHEATEEDNPAAIALLTASFREVLRSRTLEAFGLPQDSFEKKIVFFDLSYEERERLLSEDREDISDLEFFGDTGLCCDADDWWKPLVTMYLD